MEVRIEAAYLLDEIAYERPDAAVELYKQAFNDENPKVRMQAAGRVYAIADSKPEAAEKLSDWVEKCTHRDEIINHPGYHKIGRILKAANQATGEFPTNEPS